MMAKFIIKNLLFLVPFIAFAKSKSIDCIDDFFTYPLNAKGVDEFDDIRNVDRIVPGKISHKNPLNYLVVDSEVKVFTSSGEEVEFNDFLYSLKKVLLEIESNHKSGRLGGSLGLSWQAYIDINLKKISNFFVITNGQLDALGKKKGPVTMKPFKDKKRGDGFAIFLDAFLSFFEQEKLITSLSKMQTSKVKSVIERFFYPFGYVRRYRNSSWERSFEISNSVIKLDKKLNNNYKFEKRFKELLRKIENRELAIGNLEKIFVYVSYYKSLRDFLLSGDYSSFKKKLGSPPIPQRVDDVLLSDSKINHTYMRDSYYPVRIHGKPHGLADAYFVSGKKFQQYQEKWLALVKESEYTGFQSFGNEEIIIGEINEILGEADY